jgi:DNA polymerase/3'-5' exonuclease PolX
MDLADAVSVLQEMGDLLEIVESNRFEILSYRDAARFLKESDGDLDRATREWSLAVISGVGKGIAKVITELNRDGRVEEHERLRALFPPGLPDLLSLWGSAPRGFGSSGRDRGRQFGVLGRGCPSE